MINLEEKDTCFKRSVYAGLRYAGILNDDCGWIPKFPDVNMIESLLEKYPNLIIHREGSPSFGNSPLLVIYYTEETSGEKFNTHAVFISDAGPFSSCYNRFNIHSVISGWENINKEKQ